MAAAQSDIMSNMNIYNKKNEEEETSILEESITKIGQLLALGFGEAGSQIIGANIKAGGDFNPMKGGQKIMGIFGFCDIWQFAEVNETLDVEIMQFVNQIADIVHSQVDRLGGCANKNIGESFLIVWKFKGKDVKKVQDGK